MVWKQEVVCIAVLMAIVSSESIAMNICDGNVTIKSVTLVYPKNSNFKHCLCHVKHTDGDVSKNYTVKSKVLKGPSVARGGYYNLSFTHEGETKSIINKTKREGTQIFTSQQTIATEIRLELNDSLRRPEVLKINLFSGDARGRRLTIYCDHFKPPNRTETTTSVSVSPTSTPVIQSSQVKTISTSSGQAKTSSVSEMPTGTVSTQVLPSTAEHGSDSTIPVAGGVVGGLLCIAVGVGVTILILRRRKRDGQQKHGAVSKSSHDNPLYGAPGPDVIYDVAKHVTDEARDFDHHDAVNAPSDPNYFILEGNNGNNTSGCQDMDESGNNKQREEEDCYNHADIASGSGNRSKGDNYVNVPARTREDYDHIKPNAGFSSGQLSHPSENDEDTYDHTGQIPLPNMDSDNCYNHLGQFSSESGLKLEDCYNHVGDIPSHTTTQSEDCYNHLGQ